MEELNNFISIRAGGILPPALIIVKVLDIKTKIYFLILTFEMILHNIL